MQQLSLMATSMADYGFGRSDGHHEMVDLKRRKKPRGGLAIGRRLSTASATKIDSRGDGPPARLASC